METIYELFPHDFTNSLADTYGDYLENLSYAEVFQLEAIISEYLVRSEFASYDLKHHTHIYKAVLATADRVSGESFIDNHMALCQMLGTFLHEANVLEILEFSIQLRVLTLAKKSS